MTYKFWTDAGDQPDIEAASLDEAAEIAAETIPERCWSDGAWAWVSDGDTQVAVENPYK